jgi:hypothetical protein
MSLGPDRVRAWLAVAFFGRDIRSGWDAGHSERHTSSRTFRLAAHELLSVLTLCSRDRRKPSRAWLFFA